MAAESARRFWTIPNFLTLSRLALIPVFIWLMSRPDRRYWVWGGVLIIYGIVSDILDGFLARKLNQITESGKIMDPLADKITAGVVAVFCVLERELPVWALVAAVARDMGLLIGGQVMWKKRGVVPASNLTGKIAALFWGINLVFWVFDWQPVARYTVWPVVGLYIYAGIIYARRMRQGSA